MISAKIDTSEFRKLERQLKHFQKDFKKKVMKEVDKAALHARMTAITSIRSNGTGNTGRLAGSLKILRKPLAMKARLFTSVGYGLYVEEGRKPGRMPPVEPLADWARQKLRVGSKEARGVGFLVARKIAREGTRPQPFMQPALDAGVKMLQMNLKRMIKRL